jgi:hypothetical protein
MTIEVRQLLIRSVVDESARPHAGAAAAAGTAGWPPAGPALSAADLQALRAQLLAECRALLAEQLRQRQER